jgi:hypothetical protein
MSGPEPSTMQLSLSQAAALLGKSERQVRYLISQGKLSAGKSSGRWAVDSRTLKGHKAESPAATPSVTNKPNVDRRLREAAETPPAHRYSVRDLRAFQAAEPVYREVRAQLGNQDTVTLRLRRALDLLARGCHTYQSQRKVELYEDAREQVAGAVMDLLLDGTEQDKERTAFADRLESTLLPQLAGLIRSSEQRRRRAPFSAFGASRR